MTTKIFKNSDKLLMLIPVFGWIFIAYGLLFPIQNTYIKVMWIIDIVLSIGVHPLQLFISLPVGIKYALLAILTFIISNAFVSAYYRCLPVGLP